jgi:ribonuclease BN (tRNA processing enzyme)
VSARLVVLGSKGGPALRPGGPRPTSTLLELGGRRVVVDAGLGVTQGLVDAGVDLRTLDLIYLTHLHSDHVLELGPLLHTAWTCGLQRPVEVFGPPGSEALWAGFMASLALDIAIRIADEGRPPLAELVRWRPLEAGPVSPSGGGLQVEALRVVHPPIADAFALRFEGEGVAVVFSGDTAHHPPLADFARGAQLLVHEAMLPEGIERLLRETGMGERLRAHLERSHTTVDQAAQIAALAGVPRLLLHHLIPADDPSVDAAAWRARARAHYGGDVIVARDGLTLPLN